MTQEQGSQNQESSGGVENSEVVNNHVEGAEVGEPQVDNSETKETSGSAETQAPIVEPAVSVTEDNTEDTSEDNTEVGAEGESETKDETTEALQETVDGALASQGEAPATAPKPKKKSRQVEKADARKKLKQEMAFKKQMNRPVPMAQLVQFSKELEERFKQIGQRLTVNEMLFNSLQKVCEEKGYITEAELGAAYDFERKRIKALNEINAEEGNYVARAAKAMEFEIAVDRTKIPKQIKEDKSLTEEQKVALVNQLKITPQLVFEQKQTEPPTQGNPEESPKPVDNPEDEKVS